MSCKNCKCWDKDKKLDSDEGWCHRYPPVPIPISKVNPLTKGIETQIQFLLPRTKNFGECGEFKPRLEV
jgi:hypothetical protein